MSGAWTLWREASQAHELVRAAQVHVFAKLFLDPALNHLAVPDDALIKICSELSSELRLFTSREDARCALIVRSAIPRAVQTQTVVAMQDLTRSRYGVFRQGQQFSFHFAFSDQGEKLCPVLLGGAGTGPEDDSAV